MGRDVEVRANYTLLPTGRIFGRISQKDPSKKVSGRKGKLCGLIGPGFFQKWAEKKRPNFETVLLPYGTFSLRILLKRFSNKGPRGVKNLYS
jgi:hypothetical protein